MTALDLYFVRHGQTDANAHRRLQGIMNEPLNETGRKEAAHTRDTLAKIPFIGAYASDRSRTRETAQIILATHPEVTAKTTTAHLREYNFGSFENMRDIDIGRLMVAHFGVRKIAASLRSPATFIPLMAEGFTAMDQTGVADTQETALERMQTQIDEIKADFPNGGNVLVVSHAFIMSLYLLALDPKVKLPISMPKNASVTHVHYDENEITIGAVNATSTKQLFSVK
ncbi:hypothetical protein IV38_GL000175 [Lactobacillus selangorensis]|uniref:Phosphoglycerate mutase n=1 Tax=Lactobacillus selangorensis TaxID=81857 RepID=A0A0R2G052_9LACO|nr:histidine phosphatase family protein [Lactobacillus selangorensis]KRN29293.1 hypothetical protein IV38_GL000175 [Lactobacillus selangorensis]KRN34178.1 hypothetical protein IV40_GL000494 [Lactobacillus selangorensis]